jgi:ankyrin repeat protein
VVQCGENTPLIWASTDGFVAVVECLLKHGANIDYQNANVSIGRRRSKFLYVY